MKKTLEILCDLIKKNHICDPALRHKKKYPGNESNYLIKKGKRKMS
jgi:hypothetical protein